MLESLRDEYSSNSNGFNVNAGMSVNNGTTLNDLATLNHT